MEYQISSLPLPTTPSKPLREEIFLKKMVDFIGLNNKLSRKFDNTFGGNL